MPENKLILTLCLLCRDGQVALAKKHCGFGAGKWNGYGGKVEHPETVVDAAIREVYQESGVNISPLYLQRMALLDFHFAGQALVRRMYTFVCDHWEGEPVETEEMGEPRWFPIKDLPRGKTEVWAADPIWMPEVLAGKMLRGVFKYDSNGDNVETFDMEPTIFDPF